MHINVNVIVHTFGLQMKNQVFPPAMNIYQLLFIILKINFIFNASVYFLYFAGSLEMIGMLRSKKQFWKNVVTMRELFTLQ